ncbi:MAG: hypothetical protein EPN97_10045 [Alphaproteobacteria bacterium]|nr:MAG: hypothetical protein EPN97_10045 [Alphaproteobacteria bacterium]
MRKESHIFDLLKHWASLSDPEIKHLASAENISVLEEIVDLLGDPLVQYNIHDDNFVKVVRDMRNLYTVGSRALGAAIIEASDWVDKGQTGKAIDIYKGFLESCASKFYRKIAQSQLNKLQNLESGDSRT